MPAPVRPKPGCTSSAMKSPPAARTAATAAAKPGASAKIPSEEKIESTIMQDSPTSRSSAQAASTAARKPASRGSGTSFTCGAGPRDFQAEGEISFTAAELP